MNQNNKKLLAEKLKAKLNSPEYIAMPDLLNHNSYGADLDFYEGSPIRQRRFIEVEKEPGLIYYDQLEPTDWTEIINLIKKRNEEREKNYQAKKKKIEDKVSSQPGLFYYYGSGNKNERSNSIIDYGDKKGRYFGLWGSENGRSFYLEINSKHSVLDTFPFGKHGYYLIETDKPIERSDGIIRPWSDGGESNASNFHKWVEVGDQITITPYEVEKDSELPENLEKELTTKGKSGCDTCHKKLGKDWGGSDNFYIIKRYHGKVNIGGPVIWACQDCYPTKEQEYLQNYETVWKRYLDKNNEIDYHQIKFSFIDCYAGHKDQNGNILQQQNCSHCQPWKNHKTNNKTGKLSDKVEKEIIEWLIQYFQTNNIKHISLKNGELTITNNNNNNNNNNKLITSEQVNNDTELKNIQNLLQAKGIQDLDRQDLNITNSQTPSNSQKPQKTNYTPYLLTGAIGIGLISLVIASYYLGKKRSKKNSY